MFEALLLSVIIILICVFLLCIKILFKKNGRFPNTHIGGNPAFRKKGIKCAQSQDYEARTEMNLLERMQKEF